MKHIIPLTIILALLFAALAPHLSLYLCIGPVSMAFCCFCIAWAIVNPMYRLYGPADSYYSARGLHNWLSDTLYKRIH